MAKGKHGHVASSEPHTNDEFTIEQVVEWGGNKADFELLKNVDNVEADEDDIEIKQDLDADPVSRDEIRALIKELAFGEQFEYESRKEKKTKPLLLAPLDDDEKKDAEEAKEEKPEITKKKNKNKFKPEGSEKPAPRSKAVNGKNVSHRVLLAAHQPYKNLLVKQDDPWHAQLSVDDSGTHEAPSEDTIEKLKTFASTLMEEDAALYKKIQGKKKKSDTAWMQTVMSKGTVTDKLAALTIQVQDSPVHSMAALESLVNMVKKKGRREALLGIDTLKDIFLSELLPDKRKLQPFDQHPLSQLEELTSGNRESRDKHLLLWYFEDMLRQTYTTFITALQSILHDTIAAAKTKALGVTFELLANKPEQEKKLLNLLVNKLGDPDHKIASKAAHMLGKLVEKHPNMKYIVVLDVEQLMYRPNIATKAQYYACCFLHQLHLSKGESQLASRLLTIFFTFFKAVVKRGQLDAKMLNALLTGVNRAYPYAKVDEASLGEQMNTLYKVVHTANFNNSVQALMLLYQVAGASENISDRYFGALYQKLGDPELRTTSKQAMFLNLLFKSIKQDAADKRVQAFIRRLLQVCGHQTVSFICGALVLLSELLKLRPNLLLIHSQAQDFDSDDEEHFEDAAEDEEEEDTAAVSEPSSTAQPTLPHEEEIKIALQPKGHTTVPSWVHRHNMPGKREATIDYNPHHRNPLHCGAEKECVWELRKLMRHFHPTVALFAGKILQGTRISYPGDPLQDFTLIRFLDRFVYRNPKKSESGEGDSKSSQIRRKQYTPMGLKKVAVNSDTFITAKKDSIPEDEMFFHRFFTQQGGATKNKVNDRDSDADSVSDGEFDDFLDNFEHGIDGGEPDTKFDFAGELAKSKTKKKGKKTGDESDSGDDDDSDLLSEEEMDFGDDFDDEFASDQEDDGSDNEEEEGGGDQNEPDFDEENVAFDSDDEYSGLGSSKKAYASSDDSEDDFKLVMDMQNQKKKKKKDDLQSMFAAADQFSHLLDETAASKVDMTGSEALSNKDDHAHGKQLNWEADRDRWVRGQDWKSKKRQKKHQGGGKPGPKFLGNKKAKMSHGKSRKK